MTVTTVTPHIFKKGVDRYTYILLFYFFGEKYYIL
jgi:hypothetical protein